MSLAALIDDDTAIRCLKQTFDQLGVKYREVQPGEQGGFFIENKNGELKRYEPKFYDIFPDAPKNILNNK